MQTDRPPGAAGGIPGAGSSAMTLERLETEACPTLLPAFGATPVEASPIDTFLGVSELAARVRRQAAAAAVFDRPVLILGETGTGKSLLASCIHVASQRRRERFVSVSCAAINPSLAESEL